MIITILYSLSIALLSASFCISAQSHSVDYCSHELQEQHAQVQADTQDVTLEDAVEQDVIPECETVEELLENLTTEQRQELQEALAELRTELSHAFSAFVYEAMQSDGAAQGFDDLLHHIAKRYPVLQFARNKLVFPIALDVPINVEL